MTRKFIIDCDPGLDDAKAILTLINDPNIELLAVTVASGNSHAILGSYNASCTLNAINKCEIPVFQGPLMNLDGETIHSDFYFGPSGFGTLRLHPCFVEVRKDMLAPDALISYTEKYPNEITLICIGPLTNLARAYQQKPSINGLFKTLFIMGGDSSEKTVSNVTEYAEFNFWADPTAAEIVMKNFGLNSSYPMYLVDFTLCRKYPIDLGFYQHISNQLRDKGKISIAEIFGEIPAGVYVPPNTDMYTVEMIVADEFAALIAYDYSIITASRHVVCKSIDKIGPMRGHSVFESSSKGNIILIEDIDFIKFKNTIVNIMLKSIYLP